MTSRRMITSETWEDDFFTSLIIFERLLWIGLITGCADDQGRLQDSASLIRAKVFPIDDIPVSQVEEALIRFCKDGKIARYIASGKHIIQIVQWWKHQTPRWAGKSNYQAPPGWTDRERYHGPENKLITKNWDSKGGYTVDYIADNTAPYTTNDVNDDVNVNDDVKGDDEALPPDPFDQVQSWLEKVTGLCQGGEPAVKAIQEITEIKPLFEDVESGFKWHVDKKGRVKYYSNLIGPIRTAKAIRIQGSNGHKPGFTLSVDADGITCAMINNHPYALNDKGQPVHDDGTLVQL
jgi:hypothetical protein